MQHFVLQLNEAAAGRIALDRHRIELRLDVQRLDQRVRIEEQLQERVEQLADPPDRRAMGLVERLIGELIVRQRLRGFRRLLLAELLQEVRPDAARIEEFLQLDRRKLADFLLGVVDAALLADARADLLHDLFDVDRVGADVEIRHR